MSTTTENGSGKSLLVAQPAPSFLDSEIQLKKLAKKLEKITPAALEVLEKLLASDDEKIQLQAATKLLEFEVDIKKVISQDQMQRLIAEIKLKGQPAGRLLPADSENERPARPLVDFHSIQKV